MTGKRYGRKEVTTIIAKVMDVQEYEITGISALKAGMTNQSFLFVLRGKKYIMRIPGEGTKHLISRKQEADVYRVLKGKKVCDDIVYVNPLNGYKVTEYWEGARVCNPGDISDVRQCIVKLRQFHEWKLQVAHKFDLFQQILFYESLWGGALSGYEGYGQTKQRVFALLPYIEAHRKQSVLTHMDAVPDNFLFVNDEIRLIDWEYAGMQDPHVDLAMFCIYAFYDKKQIDGVIDIYFKGECRDTVRIKIYCYVAVCGLLWSCWCEYKKRLGVEFGEYAQRQYRYAAEYSRIAQAEIRRMDGGGHVSG